jgi:hypothetical protein
MAGPEKRSASGRWGHARFVAPPLLILILAALGLWASTASAVPPMIGATYASAVFTNSARLHSEINPNDLTSSYHFDYIPAAAYEANLAASKDGFAGALRSPADADASISSGSNPVAALQLLFDLQPDTAYRYRAVASSSDPASPTFGSTPTFVTQPPPGPPRPDDRGWEMVSPVDKNGGRVDPPGTLAGGAVLQAAGQGGSVTYSSAASFAGGLGAPPASQYIATRTAGGWSTENVTAPLFSGSYDTEAGGAPYRLFSGDLARGLLLSGRDCRGGETGCPVANPPLSGTDAPAGYRNYYLRESGTGTFEALVGAAEVTGLHPAAFELSFAGASPDLRRVALSSCAALTPAASDGCGTGKPNLYRWSGGDLSLLSASPGAVLAAQAGAISSDGSRIYWSDLASGDLYLRDVAQTKHVDADAGGGGSFETASADGTVAFFTKAGHLWRYEAAADSAIDLTPAGDALGVLGASADASHVYYLTSAGLFLWRDGEPLTEVAEGADASNYPAASGAARVSADGAKLLFVSTAPLTTSDGDTYDNTDLNTKAADSQVYLYDATAGTLTCVSCNPTGGRPIGPSTIPGAIANGTGLEATVAYKPRALVAGGSRVFFDSDDALVLADTNKDTDAYQWEAQGTGSCTREEGCVSLISSGRSPDGASFVDASADGEDAFFLTSESLVGRDPGSIDLYDARVGGGFPEPPTPIPCNGDACQVLPASPGDPTLTTLLSGPGNPPERYGKYGPRRRCPKGKRLKRVRRNGRAVKRCVRR